MNFKTGASMVCTIGIDGSDHQMWLASPALFGFLVEAMLTSFAVIEAGFGFAQVQNIKLETQYNITFLSQESGESVLGDTRTVIFAVWGLVTALMVSMPRVFQLWRGRKKGLSVLDFAGQTWDGDKFIQMAVDGSEKARKNGEKFGDQARMFKELAKSSMKALSDEEQKLEIRTNTPILDFFTFLIIIGTGCWFLVMFPLYFQNEVDETTFIVYPIVAFGLVIVISGLWRKFKVILEDQFTQFLEENDTSDAVKEDGIVCDRCLKPFTHVDETEVEEEIVHCPTCGKALKSKALSVGKSLFYVAQHRNACKQMVEALREQSAEYLSVLLLTELQHFEDEEAHRLSDMARWNLVIRFAKWIPKLTTRTIDAVLTKDAAQDNDSFGDMARGILKERVQQIRESGVGASIEKQRAALHMASKRQLNEASKLDQYEANEDEPLKVSLFSFVPGHIVLFAVSLAAATSVLPLLLLAALFYSVRTKAIKVVEKHEERAEQFLGLLANDPVVAETDDDAGDNEYLESDMNDVSIVIKETYKERLARLENDVKLVIFDLLLKARKETILYPIVRRSKGPFTLRTVMFARIFIDSVQVGTISLILLLSFYQAWVQSDIFSSNWINTHMSSIFLTVAAVMEPLLAYRTSGSAFGTLVSEDGFGRALSSKMRANFFDSPQDIVMKLSSLCAEGEDEERRLVNILAGAGLERAYDANLIILGEFTFVQLTTYLAMMLCGLFLDDNRNIVVDDMDWFLAKIYGIAFGALFGSMVIYGVVTIINLDLRSTNDPYRVVRRRRLINKEEDEFFLISQGGLLNDKKLQSLADKLGKDHTTDTLSRMRHI